MLLWAQLGGLAFIGLLVAARGDAPDDPRVLWAIPAALSGTAGLYAYYRGMATGTMSVVAPIAGASAVIPVVWGIARGDRPQAVQLTGVACAIAGVVLASREQRDPGRRLAAGVGLAMLAAVGFGFYFPPMHAAGSADAWWASFVFRASAAVIVIAAVAVRRPAVRLGGWPLLVVIGVGCGDTLGNLLFAASSSHGLISLTSVLASLYPIITVVLATIVLHERLTRVQLAGVVLTIAGIALIAV